MARKRKRNEKHQHSLRTQYARHEIIVYAHVITSSVPPLRSLPTFVALPTTPLHLSPPLLLYLVMRGMLRSSFLPSLRPRLRHERKLGSPSFLLPSHSLHCTRQSRERERERENEKGMAARFLLLLLLFSPFAPHRDAGGELQRMPLPFRVLSLPPSRW